MNTIIYSNPNTEWGIFQSLWGGGKFCLMHVDLFNIFSSFNTFQFEKIIHANEELTAKNY